MTRIDNVYDSLDDIYQMLFEAGNTPKDPNRPLSAIEKTQYKYYSGEDVGTHSPKYVREHIQLWRNGHIKKNTLNAMKAHGSDVSNLEYASETMPKHELRKSYYEAALNMIADTYSKYGVHFSKAETLNKIMEDDKSVNDYGGWNTVNPTIMFVAHDFANVNDMVKNAVIYKLRGGNRTFHSVVNNLTFFLANLQKVDQKAAVEEAEVHNEMIITGLTRDQVVAARQARAQAAAKAKVKQIPANWKHLADIEDEVDKEMNPPSDDPNMVDLTHYVDNSYDDRIEGDIHLKPGESLGEYMLRVMHGCLTVGPDSRKAFEAFKMGYAKDGGIESTVDWPMGDENYSDYLQHMENKPGETMADFAYRIFYNSKAVYGEDIPGSIVQSLPSLKPDAEHTAERLGVNNFAKESFEDWLIANNMLAQSK